MPQLTISSFTNDTHWLSKIGPPDNDPVPPLYLTMKTDPGYKNPSYKKSQDDKQSPEHLSSSMYITEHNLWCDWQVANRPTSTTSLPSRWNKTKPWPTTI